jgi:hypothetical protein
MVASFGEGAAQTKSSRNNATTTNGELERTTVHRLLSFISSVLQHFRTGSQDQMLPEKFGAVLTLQ